ncbi:hypothetical protein B5M42_011015 [Paenibacillus athensensis]|uniref:Butirosin biosynthesis protein H N-terminal domain-containing protein n=1 Tax=Paenibacillus athensensis TaxID=1967502 RepID=A0A4Y8PY32_9BACL|nr:hypothetical protein [Paenibacillus athensensis]MCD1259363.1 hypothetical protein [Paenibacillus athensensis]
MGSKTISIHHHKEITVYPNVAYPLCFILAEPRLTGWYYEHFVNVYSQCWGGNFFRIDFLDSSRFFGDILDRRSYTLDEMREMDIISFIKQSIKDGFGVNVFAVDEYYLSETSSYMHKHYIHETLVYGYDDDKAKLLVVGYDRNGVYTQFTYSYEGFARAFKEGVLNAPEYLVDALQTIRLRHFFMDYEFELSNFVAELGKYLQAVPDRKKIFFSIASADTVVSGFKVYEQMLRIFEENIRGNYAVQVNYNAIHFMSEHAKALKERFLYISRQYKVSEDFARLVEEYARVEKELDTVRLIFLKQALEESEFRDMDFVKDPLKLRELHNMITSSKANEYEILSRIYEQLIRCSSKHACSLR